MAIIMKRADDIKVGDQLYQRSNDSTGTVTSIKEGMVGFLRIEAGHISREVLPSTKLEVWQDAYTTAADVAEALAEAIGEAADASAGESGPEGLQVGSLVVTDVSYEEGEGAFGILLSNGQTFEVTIRASKKA